MSNEISLRNLKATNTTKKPCVYCGEEKSLPNIKRHELSCGKNPSNQKPCPVCEKMFSGSSVTCSYSCSNKHFASVRNKPDKYKSHRTICFHHHEKKCIVCGEDKIVEVHHIDENHNNNDPTNLVPLCPTHHQYVHSRYRNEVLPIIKKFICA